MTYFANLKCCTWSSTARDYWQNSSRNKNFSFKLLQPPECEEDSWPNKMKTKQSWSEQSWSVRWTSNSGAAVGEHSTEITKLPCFGLPAGGLPSSACQFTDSIRHNKPSMSLGSRGRFSKRKEKSRTNSTLTLAITSVAPNLHRPDPFA